MAFFYRPKSDHCLAFSLCQSVAALVETWLIRPWCAIYATSQKVTEPHLALIYRILLNQPYTILTKFLLTPPIPSRGVGEGGVKLAKKRDLIANLWNPFNRVRIIMVEYACTQIRTSSSCSSERKFFLAICFEGSEYFVHMFNRPVDENGQKKCWPIVWPPRLRVWPNLGFQVGTRWRFCCECYPSIADWSLNMANVSAHRKKISPHRNRSTLG